jgi:ABC-2 type transport system permease protein
VDGAITVLFALPIALLVFQLDLSQTNIGFLTLCVILISITATGLGYIMGVVTLLSRDGWMITSTLSLAFYVLIGVNFPIDLLPPALKSISLALPMTRGIQAARLALGGAPFSEFSSLIAGEVLVGLIYIIFGYALFRVVERLSCKSGMLDNF